MNQQTVTNRDTTNRMPAVQQKQDLAMANGRSFMPSEAQWRQIKEMGLAAFKSGMLPNGIKSPEAAAIIGLKAYELGIPLMEGFAHIHVINGKPTISREMMQTLVYQNIPGAVIDILESSIKVAKVMGKRPGRQPFTLTFTIEDARVAGLLAKPGPWQQYPAAMLLNRAISALCRAYFPDGLRGCSYTPEELEPAIETTSRRIAEEPAPDLTPQKPAAVEVPAEVEQPQAQAPTEAKQWVPEREQPQPEAPKEEPSTMRAVRMAELAAIVDKAKWPDGTVLAYAKTMFPQGTLESLNEPQWRALLNVVRNSNAEAALGEFHAMGSTRV